MIIGYTAGVFDLFHVGHLILLKNAKAMCDKLIVGVTTDELLKDYKGQKPVIHFDERCEIIRNIKGIDAVIAQESMNKFAIWEKLKFDIMVVGDDWYKTEKWKQYEEQFQEVGVRIIYFPYTKGSSSTLINEVLLKLRTQEL
ncbi:MAG: adenylyltransferase/cytidyltransferase family protein [Candidatus Scalindua sp.]